MIFNMILNSSGACPAIPNVMCDKLTPLSLIKVITNANFHIAALIWPFLLYHIYIR